MTRDMNRHQNRLREELLVILLVGVLLLLVAVLLSRVKMWTTEMETPSTIEQVTSESSQQNEIEGGKRND
jgi:cell division protein FtsL